MLTHYPMMSLTALGKGRMPHRYGNQRLLGEFGRLAILVGLALLLYTIAVASLDPSGFVSWLNTLVSTGVSVFFALLVGLLLFNHQTRVTSQARKAELSGLLRTELSEVKRIIEESGTKVPDEALEMTSKNFAAHEMTVSTHYANPLIVEEAVRSGLFVEENVAEMLALARNMRAHNVRVQEFISMGSQIEEAWPDDYPEGWDKFVRLYVKRAEAGRSVQRSEDRIVGGCEVLLEGLADS